MGFKKGEYKHSKESIEKIRQYALGRKQSPETIQKRTSKQMAEKHPRWKGDNVQYKQVHIWIREHSEVPEKCQECNKETRLDLANVTGIYSRDLNNYQWLCRSCHQKLDFKRGLR